MKLNIFFLLMLLAAACNRPSASSDAKMNLLANRTCRAITIRQKRFALANQIRFTLDTLAGTKSKIDSDRLQASLTGFSKQKAILLKESLRLADTIHKQMDTLVPYSSKAAEKRFTAQLNALLEKKGCKANDAIEN